MNCVNRQQLKGFCLIQDQDNFNIKTSLTTKHTEVKLSSCCINGVRAVTPTNAAPTKNLLAVAEAKLVPPSFPIKLIGWLETHL